METYFIQAEMFSLQKPHETLRRELGGVGNPIADMITKAGYTK